MSEQQRRPGRISEIARMRRNVERPSQTGRRVEHGYSETLSVPFWHKDYDVSDVLSLQRVVGSLGYSLRNIALINPKCLAFRIVFAYSRLQYNSIRTAGRREAQTTLRNREQVPAFA